MSGWKNPGWDAHVGREKDALNMKGAPEKKKRGNRTVAFSHAFAALPSNSRGEISEISVRKATRENGEVSLFPATIEYHTEKGSEPWYTVHVHGQVVLVSGIFAIAFNRMIHEAITFYDY